MTVQRICIAVPALAIFTLGGLQAEAGLGPVFFGNETNFTQFATAQGKATKGVEDFEYAQMSGGKTPFPDPLDASTPSVPFPNGLMSPNLRIQTNRNPGPLAAPDAPSGNSQALFVVSPGAFGSNSFKVGEDLGILAQIHCSMDLIFTTNDKTAVSFELSRFNGYGNAGWIVGVFDTSNNLIGSMPINGPVPTNPLKNFFGVWSPVPIGRINIYDFDPTSPDAVDDITMWTVPTPGTAGVMVLGGVALTRRRRRS